MFHSLQGDRLSLSDAVLNAGWRLRMFHQIKMYASVNVPCAQRRMASEDVSRDVARGLFAALVRAQRRMASEDVSQEWYLLDNLGHKCSTPDGV